MTVSKVNGANSVLIVDRDEVDRLRKRFMKLDKVRTTSCCSFFVAPAHRTYRITQEQ